MKDKPTTKPATDASLDQGDGAAKSDDQTLAEQVMHTEKRDEKLAVCIWFLARVVQEGVDVPALRSVVIAAGGQSTIAAIQRVGRGLRTQAGKTSCDVWEFLDRGQRWLEAHSRARRRAYEAEGYTVLVEHL
jgi:superfamily II DNA or RNA helicase